MKPDSLPFVSMNLACTADGKIAFANGKFIPFGSRRDHDLLLQLRARADAVMCGARTVNQSPVTLGPGAAKYRQLRLKNGRQEHNLRVVVSGSGAINPRAEIFKHKFSPIIILTTARIKPRRLKQLQNLGAEVRICGETELKFHHALRWLKRERGVKHLLCEGGGTLNDSLFRAGLVNQVHLTLCPIIFGGVIAPTLSDGLGQTSLAHAAQLELKSTRRLGDELFLTYRVI